MEPCAGTAAQVGISWRASSNESCLLRLLSNHRACGLIVFGDNIRQYPSLIKTSCSLQKWLHDRPCTCHCHCHCWNSCHWTTGLCRTLPACACYECACYLYPWILPSSMDPSTGEQPEIPKYKKVRAKRQIHKRPDKFIHLIQVKGSHINITCRSAPSVRSASVPPWRHPPRSGTSTASQPECPGPD